MAGARAKELYAEIGRHLAGHLFHDRAFIGFDGFIDEIIHVVDQRKDVSHYTRLKTLNDYGERICRAAGLSTNIEYVPVQVKLGGNGTIFANALLNYGQEASYVGALGLPPSYVFAPLTERARVFSIAEPGRTDAVEFDDGKLIVSKLETFRNISYEQVLDVMGMQALIREVESSALVAFMNWTMIPAMTGIWKGFLADVAPRVSSGKIMFFDLADPEKRTRSDLQEALNVICQFAPKFRAILGLNLKEAKQVAEVLGVENTGGLEQLARGIAGTLPIDTIVIHKADGSCAVSGSQYVHVEGPYCRQPILTTGAGDNFNAGLCFGLMQEWPIEQSLIMGAASSGYYVRQGRSAGIEEISDFIRDLAHGRII